ncbi:hypothetical protein [Clostridium tagluense]|uniref:hypothetical protein n=1 Tax=Clostridium tagluense TaxID=360422 RepID=UPI001CF2B46D|nr:hypothetical protein [Clostridium tagluense]MCB2296304.1 hypothetical protein [Clostridium tagluense]
MQGNNSTINLNCSLHEKYYIDDIVSVYPNSDNFNDIDYPPCTFSNPHCCGDSSQSSITSDVCENLDNKDIQVELEIQERILTIKVNYPNGNKENFYLDFLL